MADPVMQRQASRSGQHAGAASLGPWFHNLHLPDGTQTAPDHPLGDFPARKWAQLAPHLPADLAGWTVLDVGCNAGYYSFALAARGAEVLGIDAEPHFLVQARWAARQLGVEGRVRFEERQVYDVGRSEQRFDLVLFMGVLYHLRHPLLALDLLAARTRRLLVFQTLTLPGTGVVADTADRDYLDREALHARDWPRLAFIEHRFAGDATNWWMPNHAACEAMLRSAGLRIVRRPGHEIYLCEPAPEGEGAAGDAPGAAARAELAAVFGTAAPQP
jgi:tRNA (mo5U34)-methyltransferase